MERIYASGSGERLEIDVVGSLFRAGSAYGERAGRLASGIELTVTLNF